jgi:hypothetical protein
MFGARTRLAGCAIGAAFAIVACGDDTLEPGFESLGGDASGANGGGGAAGNEAAGGATTGSATTGSATTGSGEASSSSSSTGGAGSGGSGVGGGASCDTGSLEPNDTEQEATNLGTMSDCDDQAASVGSSLDGFGDVDWFEYLGADASTLCSVDPGVTITSSHELEICLFFQCVDGTAPDFGCPSTTTPTDSPEGRPGCCSGAPFEFALTCGSSAFNADDARVFVRIAPKTNLCTTYSLEYDY